jgi:hypothetical protein
MVTKIVPWKKIEKKIENFIIKITKGILGNIAKKAAIKIGDPSYKSMIHI